MANSSVVSAGDVASATQYNNLRLDVIDTSTGHTHSGTDSKVLADDAVINVMVTDDTLYSDKLNNDIYLAVFARNYFLNIVSY